MAQKLDDQQLQMTEGVLEAIESFYTEDNRCALLPVPTLVRALGFEDDPEPIFDALKHLLSVDAIEMHIDGSDAPKDVQRLQMPGPEIGSGTLSQIRIKGQKKRHKPRARLGFIRPKQVPGTPLCGAGRCERFKDSERYAQSYEYPALCCEPDLKSYDLIAVNTSGGKDSQAMLDAVYRRCCELGIEDRIVAYHADLRRVEWPGAKETAELQAEHYGVPFRASAKSGYDSLLERVEKRGEWPSGIGVNTQFCTAEFKRNVVTSMVIADTKPLETKLAKSRKVRVLNCIGVRAEESSRRSKMDPFQAASSQHGTTKTTRQVDTWLPIFYWTPGEVWDVIRRSAVPHHWAYDIGLPRLSCVFCVFGNRDALMLAGMYNPELLAEYVKTEKFLASGPLDRCPQFWDMQDGCVPTAARVAEHRKLVRKAKKEGLEPPPDLSVILGTGACRADYVPGKVCVPTAKAKAQAAKQGKKLAPKASRQRHWKFTPDMTIEDVQQALEAGELPGEELEIDSQL